MAARKVKVIYSDDREPVEVKITPRAQVATERHIGGDWSSMAVLSLFYVAWAALSKADPTNTPDFDTWLDEVDDVEPMNEEKDPDPTQPAPSNDSSSESPFGPVFPSTPS